MQEVAERHRCVRALEYRRKMLTRNCGEATGVPHMKPHECRKLLRGTGDEYGKEVGNPMCTRRGALHPLESIDVEAQ